MNRLPRRLRAQALGMLVEGCSIRSTARVCDIAINTVIKLLVDAGEACARFHDDYVIDIPGQRNVQMDEIWAFCYAKKSSLPERPPEWTGDVWTWLAMDRDSKLLLSWMVGNRGDEAATALCHDLRVRLLDRPRITTDGYRSYPPAIEAAFGSDVDYGQSLKRYRDEEIPQRRYSPSRVLGATNRVVMGAPELPGMTTSHIERQNLTLRMMQRRFTRLTNAFSKKIENHGHAVALHAVYYNWCWVHGTLKMTPAMAAGLTGYPRDTDWIVGLI